MAGELFQKPGAEEQKSAFEQAGQDLRQNQVEDGDTKDQIQAKVDRLGKTRLSLEAAYNKAEAAQKYDETPKLFAMTAQVDEGIAALQKAQEQAPYKETPVSERKMERGEERQKTVDELKADIQEQSKVIDDPKKSAEEKQAAQEKRAEAQKELKVLERKEGRDEAMATVAKYKAEEAKSRAEDAVRLAELEQELEGKSPDEAKAAVEGTTETSDGQAKQADQKSPDQSRPERKGSFGERADRLVKGTLLEILGHPPKTPFEKFTTSSKVLMIRFALAFGGGARREWMKDLREPQKNILKKITGLVITPRANPKDGEPLFDLDWGEPDKEYLGPSKTTQDVFAKYFTENEWLSVYDRVASLNEGKATVAQVKASFATPPSSDDQWLQKLMDDLGAQDGDVFLDAVSKRGYSLLDSDKPAQSPAGPVQSSDEPDQNPSSPSAQ